MITTCQMSWGTATYRQPGDAVCGNPLPLERHDHGPWMCDECIARAQERASHVEPSRVPVVADVWQEMLHTGATQADAVRKLGGQP